MRIGELSSRSGVPVKTIRYYGEIDVLAATARTSSGYRDYDEDAVDRLAFIRAAQAVGLTLGEIRQVVALRERGKAVHRCGWAPAAPGDRDRAADHRDGAPSGRATPLTARAQSLDPANCDAQRVCHVIAPRHASM